MIVYVSFDLNNKSFVKLINLPSRIESKGQEQTVSYLKKKVGNIMKVSEDKIQNLSYSWGE